tara:strand:+ start:474 stop:1175 length:702 start_codon:yes stop_codon:yes gene_type:complete
MSLTRNNIEEIIRRSLEKSKNQRDHFSLFGRISIYINNPLVSEEVDFEQIVSYLEENIPPHMFDEIDLIMVGENPYLDEKELEATYKDGAILIRSTLLNNRDYIENILHEMAHGLEYRYGMFIYSDFKLEQEFLGKRERFYHLASAEGYDIEYNDFMNPEYSKEFDDFLYKEIGYEKLNNLLMGLFISPYAATSLQEYFANGVENYFLDDRDYLRKISPVLTEKIIRILENEQ